MSDTTELLDQLDALHAAGTPGEWGVYWGDHIGSGVVWTTPNGSGVTVENDICEMQDEDDRACTDNTPNPASPSDDAALIVAAVNALPQLTAALRAVLDLADELSAKCPPDDWGSGGIDDAIQADTARGFRSIITAALSPLAETHGSDGQR